MILIDAEYKGELESKVVLYGRGVVAEDKEFLPYIYIIPKSRETGKQKSTEEILKNKKIVKVEEVKLLELGKPIRVWKVYFRHPKDIPGERDKLQEFGKVHEADIPFIRRYLIDKKLKPLFEITEKGAGKEAFELKTLAFDIECLSEAGIEIGRDPIIMISFWGDGGFSKVIGWGDLEVKGLTLVEDEEALLREFVATINAYQPEAIVGYNSDGFDWPYIKERARRFKVPLNFGEERLRFVKKGRDLAPKINGVANVDLYLFIKNLLSQYLKSENMKLNTVARELVGEEKVDIGGGTGINEAYKNNPEELYKYALQDAKITYLLAKEVLPMVYELSKLVGQTVFDVSRMSSGQVVEWLLIRKSSERGALIPNRPGYEKVSKRRSESYEGAFVKDPLRGLHSPISVCDFRSLYPTIIMAHNISPETVVSKGENVSPSGTVFSLDREGFIPSTLKSIFDERMELKAKMRTIKKTSHEYKILHTRQNALKLVLNSFYGYLGYANARWYHLDSAKAITSWGRQYIKEIIEMADASGFTVVYGDTDSVMLTSTSHTFETDVKNFIDTVNKKLPNPIKLELDGFFVRGVFVTKKRYALLSSDGNLVVKGLEKVRRDWSSLARDAQEKVIRLILENKVDDATIHVKALVKKLRAKEIPLDRLIIRTQLTKKLSSYTQMAPHVKVAHDMENSGEPVYPGMIIEYIVTPRAGSISEKSVNLKLAKDYDADYYIDHQLLPAVMRVMEAVGGDEKDLKMKQAGLDNWLS
ncbi:MAG: hypothetical protein GOU98_00995 [Candidatus Altiarchaeota archaeon]|nr:hypothetical protein [Candidatus Altiarchaeota archaeon]